MSSPGKLRTLRKQTAGLVKEAVTSRLGILATCGFSLSMLCVAMGAGWADHVQRSAEKAPLEQAANLAKLLKRILPPDVAAQLQKLAPTVLLISFGLIITVPLLAAAFAAALRPVDRSGLRVSPWSRLVAALMATAATIGVMVPIVLAAAQLAYPGGLAAADMAQLGWVSAIALVGSLPSVAVATAARDLVVRGLFGVPLALAAAVAVRYALPMLARTDSVARWFMPRSYEMWMLSVSTQRAAAGAVLCLVWAAALLMLDDALLRLSLSHKTTQTAQTAGDMKHV